MLAPPASPSHEDGQNAAAFLSTLLTLPAAALGRVFPHFVQRLFRPGQHRQIVDDIHTQGGARGIYVLLLKCIEISGRFLTCYSYALPLVLLISYYLDTAYSLREI